MINSDKGISLSETLCSLILLSVISMGTIQFTQYYSKLSLLDLALQKEEVQISNLSSYIEKSLSWGMHWSGIKNSIIHPAGRTEFPSSKSFPPHDKSSAISIRSFYSDLMHSPDGFTFCQTKLNPLSRPLSTIDQWLVLNKTSESMVEGRFKKNSSSNPLCQEFPGYSFISSGEISSPFGNSSTNTMLGAFFIPIAFSQTIYLDRKSTLRVFDHAKARANPMIHEFPTIHIERQRNMTFDEYSIESERFKRSFSIPNSEDVIRSDLFVHLSNSLMRHDP